MATSAPAGVQEGISSFLDTDLYKLTMQCAILKYLPDIEVTYAFTNRTPSMRLSRRAFEWVQAQTRKLGNIRLSEEEQQFLRQNCKYLSERYISFLAGFRLRPDEEVTASFTPEKDTGSPDDLGHVHYDVAGLWLNTILYEIPLLALTSEAYFKFCDRDWVYDGQEQKAYDKAALLLSHGCIFSEFGTRRRRDYHTHDLVMQGLVRASKDLEANGGAGKLSGTSNVHFAMRYGIPSVGTVAHEWFMGIASITNDYEHANETALRYWVGCFGEGVLGIALTDTFGTPVFLKAFQKALPNRDEAERNTVETQIPHAPRPALSAEEKVVDVPASGGQGDSTSASLHPRTYAQTFTGVRQDSGNPLEFVDIMREFYDKQGIHEKKTIVFSDSLNTDRCLEYKRAAEAKEFLPTFGIGTYFTNDFTSPQSGRKSSPMNIVIKLSSASGRPSVKISDNIGKNTGDKVTVSKVKEVLGYTETEWAAGNEKPRWGRVRKMGSFDHAFQRSSVSENREHRLTGMVDE